MFTNSVQQSKATSAYSQFRMKRCALISGEKLCNGTFGKAIDAFCVWATLLGVVTGIGTGAMQMTGGLSYLRSSIPSLPLLW